MEREFSKNATSEYKLGRAGFDTIELIGFHDENSFDVEQKEIVETEKV